MSRAATDDESDARHSNETGVKKKHEKTRKEAYAQSRTRSVWLNRIMTRCLITNYAAYATTDSRRRASGLCNVRVYVSTSNTLRRKYLCTNVGYLYSRVLRKRFPDLQDILFHSYAFFIQNTKEKTEPLEFQVLHVQNTEKKIE